MATTLAELRTKDRRLAAESARAVKSLDAAFSEDVLQEALGLIATGTKAPVIRRRGRPVIQLAPSEKNVVAWSIGQRIRAARERKDWRQEDLAQESGIARANIARLERGNQIPKVATLRRVANALGLEVDVLLKAPEPVTDKEGQDLAEAGMDSWASELGALDKGQ